MSALMSVAVIGIIVLLGLAVVVGRLEGRAKHDAWQGIAERRRVLADLERHLAEQREELLEWESALADESERRRLM